jgi:Domain of unknown function (DUF4399)
VLDQPGGGFWLRFRIAAARSRFKLVGDDEMIGSIRVGLALLAAFAVADMTQAVAQTPSPAGAKVYFINLKDGAEVTSPFLVQFGLTGMGIAPAGVEKPNTGHHHLLIDTTLTADQMKEAIPADDTHKHFGGGQTEAMVSLPKGQHTLQLVLADWTHIPHVPPVMSETITITVR